MLYVVNEENSLVDTDINSLIKQNTLNNYYVCTEHPTLKLIHRGLVKSHLNGSHGIVITEKTTNEALREAIEGTIDKPTLTNIIEDLTIRQLSEEGSKIAANHRLIYMWLELRRLKLISPDMSYADWLEASAIAWVRAYGVTFVTRFNETNITQGAKIYNSKVREEWEQVAE